MNEQEVNRLVNEMKGMPEDVPEWDIALAALARDESEKLGRALLLADFQRLAAEHAIRFDDIMVTMFELVVQGQWTYQQEDGRPRKISRDELENLYVGGRLSTSDVAQYTGLWQRYLAS
ncbi:MAG: hypothetical protein GXP17_06280 [Gammaproteobacteria bacterium]|nr:hypothetical protein [Gammaproteobacteria bacterium]